MVVLGLGSNVGDRFGYLSAAVAELSLVLSNMRFSRILESAAVLPLEKVEGMDRPFYNMVLCGDTSLSPSDLLAKLKNIEIKLGRVKRCVWGPREIDIDILAIDDQVIVSDLLTVPHPEMLHRDFVVIPFADVAINWRYPVKGEFYGLTIAQLIASKSYEISENLKETGLCFP